MGIYLNPDNDLFQISVNSEIYVDKSELIRFTNRRLGQEKRFLCVSRPRRFGKSMAANMLTAYYSRGCDSRALFENLKIAKDANFEEHLNQYDVLALNIQHFLSQDGTMGDVIPLLEKKVIKELQEAYADVLLENVDSLSTALATIFNQDPRVNKGFIIIIDEWDCIFREAREDKETQKKYLDFLKDLLKDRAYVRLAYMTGILPIKKYGTHSALNIFEEFSMTNPKRLAEFIGFTESEVRDLCDRYGMDFLEAKRWYDGYRFKHAGHVYNPKSIVDAMMDEEFHSYWTSTETYEALKIYIDLNYDGLKDAIISMLGGVPICVDTGTFQNDMTTFASKEDVLTLLVHLGYLAYDLDREAVFIPNEEVKAEFVRAVKQSGWSQVIDAITASDKLMEATLKGDGAVVANAIDNIHTENTSILSYNDENSLSCVITLAYYSARKDYVFVREFPTGKGFADLVLVPRKGVNKPAVIIELKWDVSAQGAIGQIKEKRYVQALEDYGGEVLLVGINYNKTTKEHQCEIEMVQQ